MKLWLALFTAWALIPILSAEINTRGGKIELELVPEVESIVPGQPFSVALHLKHEPGWHSYWSHPGLVGVPTSLDWDLPAGFQAGPIQWPTPERVQMLTINAYGYKREVLLMVEITPPADLKAGTEVTLKAKSAWMTCSRSCHPGYGDFSLTLPVDEKGSEPDWNLDWRSRFEAERETLPRALTGWQTSVSRDGQGNILLTLKPEGEGSIPKQAEVYVFAQNQLVDSDSPQEVRHLEDGGVEVTLASMEVSTSQQSDTFAALVYVSTGWPQNEGDKYAEIEAKW